MFSPNREPRIIENNNNTPLRAFSPIVDVIKNAQTNASRDFDRFYDNLWQKLSPRTSNNRIRKRTPDTTERMKSMLQQKREEMQLHNSTGTSLTPLIERHSIRDDARARYESNRNPFYQESISTNAEQEEDQESIMAETPGLDTGRADTPSSSLFSSSSSSYLNQNYHQSPRRSIFSSVTGNNNLNAKLAEERKRMDRLQNSMTKLRRQSSLLIGEEEEENEREPSFLLENDNEEQEEEGIMTSILNKKRASHLQPPPQRQQQHQQQMSSNLYQLATPPQSIEYNFIRNKTLQTKPPLNRTNTSPKRIRSPTATNTSPAAKRIAIAVSSSSPNNTTRHSTLKRLNVSPRRIIIDDLAASGNKLRSTEMISTPGGSMVSNRFWKEIHGLNGPQSPIKKNITTPITKRISTLQQRQASSSTRTWANDDEFWSDEPIAPSSLNHKLLQVAAAQQQEEEDQQERRTQKRFKAASSSHSDDGNFWSNNTRSDALWSSPLATRHNRELKQQQQQQQQERSVSPTPSLFKNKLFKAAARKEAEEEVEQEQEQEQASTPKPAFASAVTHSNIQKRGQEHYNTPFSVSTTPARQQTEALSLGDELESAKKRDEIIKRNNIPIMNPAVLAELKAKHRATAAFIDDSDSYKFN